MASISICVSKVNKAKFKKLGVAGLKVRELPVDEKGLKSLD